MHASVLIFLLYLFSIVVVGPMLLLHVVEAKSTQPLVLLSVFFILLEAAWTVFYWWRAVTLRSTPTRPAPFPDRKATLKRVMTQNISSSAYIKGWFHGASVAEIRRENVAEMLAANFYHKHLADLSAEEREEIEEVLDTRPNLPSGHSAHIRPLRHTLDHIPLYPQPLFVFVFAYCLHTTAAFILSQWGFRRHVLSSDGHKMTYWYRRGRGANTHPPPTPLIFLHGIGLGLLPYTGFIRALFEGGKSRGQRDVVVVELPHVSMVPVESVVPMDEKTDCLSAIISHHQLGPCSFVAHSYGTFVLARMCKRYPELIYAATFVDPVCFCLYLPDVTYNFIYRPPQKHWLELLRFYFVSRNLYFVNVLCRNFWWYQLCMWPEHIPERTAVILSMKDEIVPSASVKQWLADHTNAKVTCLNTRHIQWIGIPSAVEQIVDQENAMAGL